MLARAMVRYRFARSAVSMLAFAGGLFAFALSAGCGGPPQAPQAPSLAAPKLPLLSAPPPAFDLSAVSAPATLVVSGQLAKPSASLDTVKGWSKLPTPQSAQATEALLGDAVGALVDLDRPIDFAVALGALASKKKGGGGSFDDATPRVVVSAAISDPEAAKAALLDHYKLVPAAHGALLIERLDAEGHPGGGRSDSTDEGDPSEDVSSHRTCELAPAYGAASMRVLCAWGDARSLAELGPWLTRSATRTVSTADLHVDFAMQPLKVVFADRLKMILTLVGGLVSGSVGPTGSRDVVMAVVSDLGDFFLDLNSASLDVDLSPPVARAVKTLRFSGASSAITRLVTANADRNAAPPAVFWQMPSDATFAFFERGIAAQEFGRGRDLVLKAIGDELGQAGMKPADRGAVVRAFGELPSSSPAVYASGVDVPALQRGLSAWGALAAGASALERFEGAREAVEAGVGWHVAAIDEPATQIAAAMNDLVAALSRPGVAGVLRIKLRDSALVSLQSTSMPKRPHGDPWPAGSFHYALTLRPPILAGLAPPRAKGQLAPKPIVLHAFVVPDGARTWAAAGGDEALVSAKLAAAMTGAGETLSARAELEPLRAAVAGSGGFVTLRGLLATALPGMAVDGASDDAVDLLAGLAQLPHAGGEPITFWMSAEPGATPSTATATVQIPRGAIEDLIGVALRHGI